MTHFTQLRIHRIRQYLLRSMACALLSIVLAVPAPAQTPAQTQAATPAVGSADPAEYLNTIKELTAPAMEGRGDDTPGLMRAANLLQQRYKTLGLEPAGSHGYLQPFTLTTGAKLAGNNHLREQVAQKTQDLKLKEDFVPLSFSSSGAVDAPVVFAGYGASAGEFDYDDYANLDVNGKIVVMLRYEPAGFAGKSGNQGLTQHATMITKAINARNHGAKAVIIINGTPIGAPSATTNTTTNSTANSTTNGTAVQGQQDRLMPFGSLSGPENVGILLVQVRNNVAGAWFAAAGTSIADVQRRIDAATKPASFSFPPTVHLSMEVNVTTTRATVNNVLAYLPGKTDEYVIVGAHYDHLGYGHYDSLAPSQIGRIHPGADDNASGTAGVLELARMLAPFKGRLPRGILFASFAGEELGLLGSADWVKEPTRPLPKAVAMINMDMIGRIRDRKVYIGGVGTAANFQPILTALQKESSFQFEYSAGGYGASDHTSFVTQQIPVLFFFSGLHSDYHRPSDTWDKIDATDAAHLVDVVAKLLLQLDTVTQRPTFVTVAEDKDPHAGVSGGGGGYGPYFGSIPDFGQTENGVRFSDVQPGSPAAKAGLKAGDVLVQFRGQAIRNLYDFTDALRRSKAGDVVEVTVLRDGKPLKQQVTLEQRR